MEALSFNSLKVPLRNLKPVQLVVARRPGTCLPVHCQGGGNVVKSSVGVSSTSSSTFTEMERLQADPAGTAVMEGGSLVLAPNGRTENVAVKEMMPYGINQGHSLVEMDGGVGIIRFLRGKRLFITGATGFLAKVLVEKILRIVPDVGKIFLLIKAKDEDAARGRLTNEIMNSELFDCLRQTYGASYERFLLSKLVPVPGDVCEQKLGLGQDLTDCITDEVDIIINSAANTTFDERYDVAIGINTLGARNLMSFAKRCNKVKLFLQVSTGKYQKVSFSYVEGDIFTSFQVSWHCAAYVNGQRQGNIPEKPFSIGDSIARESLNSKKCNGSASFLTLDVEREISLAISSKKGLEDHTATQKMKELGLER
ncbi:hypothetical protein SAY87_024120 [Trapa incisa]|uniref:Fatty acyl-CoA reductase n=1 Tax=Trapa incisa TaxID=236973 RepID=A0AAN7L2D4_9MYRT|nr:hypothetical protein SAY87_024120 [Trapa incisa]